jgi:signal transduction histidine kinase
LTSGFPHSLRRLDRLTIPTAGGGLLAAAGAGIATWGLLTAMFGFPYEGLIADNAGGIVQQVTPGGLPWRNDIRPGQLVVKLDPPDNPEDWQIVTSDGSRQIAANTRAHVGELRELVPQAAVSVLLGLLALVAFVRWPTAAGLLGLGAATGGLPALWASGDDLLVPIGALALPILLAVSLVSFGPPQRWVRVAAVVAAGALAISWMVAQTWVPEAFDTVESVRAPVTVALWASVLATVVDWRSIVRLPAMDRATRLDIAVLALGAGALIGLSFILQPTWPVVVLAAFLIVILYSRSRGAVLQMFDQLFMAPVRERASIAAAEDEKARLARHIHDEPLQVLSGVIRRLEVQPATPADLDALRETADHLRDVATELNPPVLEDLGLGPALEHLAEQMNTRTPIPVTMELKDTTDYAPESRLPRDVEVTLYRIVQEALNNAETHSAGTGVRVTADLSRTGAEIEVLDDGVGISDAKVRQAQSEGHFGASSMRHRAEHIGARLQVGEARPRGTRVAVSWPRR